jgi:hypothetical protein
MIVDDGIIIDNPFQRSTSTGDEADHESTSEDNYLGRPSQQNSQKFTDFGPPNNGESVEKSTKNGSNMEIDKTSDDDDVSLKPKRVLKPSNMTNATEKSLSCCELLSLMKARTSHVEILIESLRHILLELLKRRGTIQTGKIYQNAKRGRSRGSCYNGEQMLRLKASRPAIIRKPVDIAKTTALDHGWVSKPPPQQDTMDQGPVPQSAPLRGIRVSQESSRTPAEPAQPVPAQPSDQQIQDASNLDPEVDPVDLLITRVLTGQGKTVKVSQLIEGIDLDSEMVAETVDGLVRDGLLSAVPGDSDSFTKTSPELLSPEELEPYNLGWKNYISAYYNL